MLLSNLILQAAGQDAAAAAPGAMGGGIIQALLLPVGMIAIFYFLLIRPQNQRAKKHKEMLSTLKKGDSIVTSGGILGKIAKITEGSDEVTIDTGEGMKLRVLRSTIVDLRGKGEPAPANDVKES